MELEKDINKAEMIERKNNTVHLQNYAEDVQ